MDSGGTQEPGDRHGRPAVGERTPRSIRVDGLSSLPATPQRRQQRRLAVAARELITRMVTSSAGEADLAAAADRLEEVVDLLGEMPAEHIYEGFSEAANAGPALRAMAMAMAIDSGEGNGEDPDHGTAESDEERSERLGFFDQSPLIGLANPLSPPLVLEHDPSSPERIRGTVNFGPAYEGPPGCVHGGYVAATFDELLGAAQSLSGTQGMTAHLEVDYRSPTPLGEDLELSGWVQRTEGRKIWARGTLHVGRRLCAEAEALFVAFGPGDFQVLLEARGG